MVDHLPELAQHVAALARELGILVEPTFDRERARLVDRSGLQLDLANLWYRARWCAQPDRTSLARWLQPEDVGDAGSLGRIDLIEAWIAAGVRPDADAVERTIGAWQTTDLHVACVRAMLDAGAPVTDAHSNRLCGDAVGSEPDSAIALLLAEHATEPRLSAHFVGLATAWTALRARREPPPGTPRPSRDP